MEETNNVRVRSCTRLIAPTDLKAEIPITGEEASLVVQTRRAVDDILARRDPRLLVVVGPCSIHDPAGAFEYAEKLAAVRDEVSDVFLIVMRAYFEKPRTTVGWKGLINDPHLDESCDIDTGLHRARTLLRRIAGLKLPTGTEFLDPITPQYIDDLVSWAAIGARTTESQTHREMASGLSMPVGFKNGTDGSLQVAIDAMRSAMHPHSFLGIDGNGFTSIIKTAGNASGHVVLRGGRSRTNYDLDSILEAKGQLEAAGLPPVVMVDCSHANSGKQPARQEVVWHSILDQRAESGSRSPIVGAMIESYLHEGAQSIVLPVENLKYGVSVTDACVSWETTASMLRQGAQRLRAGGGGGTPRAVDALVAAA